MCGRYSFSPFLVPWRAVLNAQTMAPWHARARFPPGPAAHAFLLAKILASPFSCLKLKLLSYIFPSRDRELDASFTNNQGRQVLEECVGVVLAVLKVEPFTQTRAKLRAHVPRAMRSHLCGRPFPFC